jgi:hypothetical protein
MNIYSVQVWGPCKDQSEVMSRRSLAPDNTATIIAPSNDIANQVCYLVSAGDVFGQSNYQEIDTYPTVISAILNTENEPIPFDSNIVHDLLTEPILPPLGQRDTQRQPGELFFARCHDDSKSDRGRFWVYALDDLQANIVALAHGDAAGLFDSDSEAIQIDLYPYKETCVFWNIKLIHEKT